MNAERTFELPHAPIVLGGRLSFIAADDKGGKSVGCNAGVGPGPGPGSGILAGGPVLLPFRVTGIERADRSWRPWE